MAGSSTRRTDPLCRSRIRPWGAPRCLRARARAREALHADVRSPVQGPRPADAFRFARSRVGSRRAPGACRLGARSKRSLPPGERPLWVVADARALGELSTFNFGPSAGRCQRTAAFQERWFSRRVVERSLPGQTDHSPRKLPPSAMGRMGKVNEPFATRIATSLVDLASLAATKRSFDVARSLAIVVRAIANDLSGEAGRAPRPR
jgi:hypothetical protein